MAWQMSSAVRTHGCLHQSTSNVAAIGVTAAISRGTLLSRQSDGESSTRASGPLHTAMRMRASCPGLP